MAKRKTLFRNLPPVVIGLVLVFQVLVPSAATSQMVASDRREATEELKLVWLGDGRAQDGTILGMRSYETTAGVKLSVIHGTFPSMESAQREFRAWLATAKRILEQQNSVDNPGRVAQERAVAIIAPTKGSSSEQTAVLWTAGVDFFWLSSTSSSLVFRVENDIKTRKSKGVPTAKKPD